MFGRKRYSFLHNTTIENSNGVCYNQMNSGTLRLFEIEMGNLSQVFTRLTFFVKISRERKWIRSGKEKRK